VIASVTGQRKFFSQMRWTSALFEFNVRLLEMHHRFPTACQRDQMPAEIADEKLGPASDCLGKFEAASSARPVLSKRCANPM